MFIRCKVDEAVFEETKLATQYFDEIESNFDIKWTEVQWSDLLKPLYCGLASRIAIEEETNGIVPRGIAEQAVIWAEHLQTIGDRQTMEAQYIDLAGSLPSGWYIKRLEQSIQIICIIAKQCTIISRCYNVLLIE